MNNWRNRNNMILHQLLLLLMCSSSLTSGQTGSSFFYYYSPNQPMVINSQTFGSNAQSHSHQSLPTGNPFSSFGNFNNDNRFPKAQTTAPQYSDAHGHPPRYPSLAAFPTSNPFIPQRQQYHSSLLDKISFNNGPQQQQDNNEHQNQNQQSFYEQPPQQPTPNYAGAGQQVPSGKLFNFLNQPFDFFQNNFNRYHSQQKEVQQGDQVQPNQRPHLIRQQFVRPSSSRIPPTVASIPENDQQHFYTYYDRGSSSQTQSYESSPSTEPVKYDIVSPTYSTPVSYSVNQYFTTKTTKGPASYSYSIGVDPTQGPTARVHVKIDHPTPTGFPFQPTRFLPSRTQSPTVTTPEEQPINNNNVPAPEDAVIVELEKELPASISNENENVRMNDETPRRVQEAGTVSSTAEPVMIMTTTTTTTTTTTVPTPTTTTTVLSIISSTTPESTTTEGKSITTATTTEAVPVQTSTASASPSLNPVEEAKPVEEQRKPVKRVIVRKRLGRKRILSNGKNINSTSKAIESPNSINALANEDKSIVPIAQVVTTTTEAPQLSPSTTIPSVQLNSTSEIHLTTTTTQSPMEMASVITTTEEFSQAISSTVQPQTEERFTTTMKPTVEATTTEVESEGIFTTTQLSTSTSNEVSPLVESITISSTEEGPTTTESNYASTTTSNYYAPVQNSSGNGNNYYETEYEYYYDYENENGSSISITNSPTTISSTSSTESEIIDTTTDSSINKFTTESSSTTSSSTEFNGDEELFSHSMISTTPTSIDEAIAPLSTTGKDNIVPSTTIVSSESTTISSTTAIENEEITATEVSRTATTEKTSSEPSDLKSTTEVDIEVATTRVEYDAVDSEAGNTESSIINNTTTEVAEEENYDFQDELQYSNEEYLPEDDPLEDVRIQEAQRQALQTALKNIRNRLQNSTTSTDKPQEEDSSEPPKKFIRRPIKVSNKFPSSTSLSISSSYEDEEELEDSRTQIIRKIQTFKTKLRKVANPIRRTTTKRPRRVTRPSEILASEIIETDNVESLSTTTTTTTTTTTYAPSTTTSESTSTPTTTSTSTQRLEEDESSSEEPINSDEKSLLLASASPSPLEVPTLETGNESIKNSTKLVGELIIREILPTTTTTTTETAIIEDDEDEDSVDFETEDNNPLIIKTISISTSSSIETDEEDDHESEPEPDKNLGNNTTTESTNLTSLGTTTTSELESTTTTILSSNSSSSTEENISTTIKPMRKVKVILKRRKGAPKGSGTVSRQVVRTRTRSRRPPMPTMEIESLTDPRK